ncbi:hypothetical protein OROGR_027515 [Orobanche gracilis]
MAQTRFYRAAFFTIFLVLCVISAAVMAQDSTSPAPAPGPVDGSGFTTGCPNAIISFSILLSLVGLLLH